MDKLDLKILNILQVEGRTKRSALAEAIGLSLPSLSERLRKLEKKEVIEGYYTKLSRKAFGYEMMAFITVVVEANEDVSQVKENIANTPEIIEAHTILGKGAYMLKIVAKDTRSLEKLLDDIKTWPGVTRTNTRFVLSTLKETTKLEI